MKKYIDTHGHLNSKEFINELDKYIDDSKNFGVDKIIIPGTNKKDSLKAIEISKKYKNTYAMVSLHPNFAKSINLIDWLDEINPNDIVGVGECGIDLYWEDNPPLKIQEYIFIKHIEYAKKYNLPIIIHTRNAEKETYEIISRNEYKKLTFVIHCLTMNKKWTKKFVNLGCYISFSGIVTFKKSHELRESLKIVPLNKLLTETDAPYLAPEPVRGKMNKPANVRYVTDFVANFRNEENDVVLKQVYKNALKTFFYKKKKTFNLVL